MERTKWRCREAHPLCAMFLYDTERTKRSNLKQSGRDAPLPGATSARPLNMAGFCFLERETRGRVACLTGRLSHGPLAGRVTCLMGRLRGGFLLSVANAGKRCILFRQLNTKCVDEESRGQSINERAGGCCEPVLDIPKATSEQFG